MILTDPGAERAVLAGVFQYGGDAFIDADDIVSSKSFTSKEHSMLYSCFQHIFKDDPNAKIDLPIVMSTAKSLRLEEATQDMKYLRAIMNFPVKLDNVRKMGSKIAKLEVARELKAVTNQTNERLNDVTGDEPIDEILALAEDPIFDYCMNIAEADNDKIVRIGDGIMEYVEWLKDNERDMIGISSGYPLYDLAIGGGFRGGTVNVIGARPKVGKTMLADNISLHVAGNSKIPVLNLDTEMKQMDHWNRMLANISGVETNNIERGKFGAGDYEKVKEAAKQLSDIPYDYRSIAGMPFEQASSVMRRWLVKNVGRNDDGLINPCLIVYDYIKLMSSDSLKALQEFQALGFMMTGMHNFTVRYDVPILAFIQLNRDGIMSESSAAASGSDRIVWLCSNFSIYKKKDEEEIAEDAKAGNRKLVPIDCRHGGGLDDGDYINFHFRGEIARISQGDTKFKRFKDRQKEQSFEVVNDTNEAEIPFE